MNETTKQGPARFETATREIRWNGKCKGCGKHHTALTNAKITIGFQAFYRTVDGVELPFNNGVLLPLCCTKRVRMQRVQGKFVATVKCDARCTHAKGHSCECSCGGKNHGSDA